MQVYSDVNNFSDDNNNFSQIASIKLKKKPIRPCLYRLVIYT